MTKIVYDLILKLEQCDDKHNRCDYLLEHDEITYLLEFIKPLYEKDKEIQRLNNIINELNAMFDGDLDGFQTINEKGSCNDIIEVIQNYKDKLKELKEGK